MNTETDIQKQILRQTSSKRHSDRHLEAGTQTSSNRLSDFLRLMLRQTNSNYEHYETDIQKQILRQTSSSRHSGRHIEAGTQTGLVIMGTQTDIQRQILRQADIKRQLLHALGQTHRRTRAGLRIIIFISAV
ncbi:hypothetical protein ElyMa_002269700 [Elysia marginata]|uniref:Uncharacterized protein n=1 Tax=Elysia marginata TaxID=1093978 RepID=A0AAV4G196_9GAST|nr:hypothetical protein ElyMa_002269700 [Elysia marginata]